MALFPEESSRQVVAQMKEGAHLCARTTVNRLEVNVLATL